MSKYLLSNRARYGVEAAPWVCDEIERLEKELEEAHAVLVLFLNAGEGFATDHDRQGIALDAASKIIDQRKG